MKYLYLSLLLLLSNSCYSMQKRGDLLSPRRVAATPTQEGTHRMLAAATAHLTKAESDSAVNPEKNTKPLERAQSEPASSFLSKQESERVPFDSTKEVSLLPLASYDKTSGQPHQAAARDLRRSMGSCRNIKNGEWRGWKYYRNLEEQD